MRLNTPKNGITIEDIPICIIELLFKKIFLKKTITIKKFIIQPTLLMINEFKKWNKKNAIMFSRLVLFLYIKYKDMIVANW